MSIGQGALRMTLGYPTGPFTDGYRATTPKLSVDGVEHATGWGEHTVALTAGPHTVTVLVYAEDGSTFGRAQTPLTIAVGTPSGLVYRAPRFRRPSGKIKSS